MITENCKGKTLKSQKLKIYPDYDYKYVSPDSDEILPVNFGTEHKAMLSLLDDKQRISCIPEKCEKLILSLRTAQAKEYSLDKEQTSYDDLLDALRLSLKGYQIE
jgi:hypothetical protein